MLVYHRNQIKKKVRALRSIKGISDLIACQLVSNWKSKKDIYTVVNDITPQGMEVTEEMWGRIAWIVGTFLFYSVTNSDHVPNSKSILRTSKGPTSGNSSTNNLLPSVRTTRIWTKQKGKLKSVGKLSFTCICGCHSDHEIGVITTSIFEECLKEHKRLCPPEKTKRGASTRSMPAWQREMNRAVQEMEQFSDEEDTDENGGANGRGEDENGEGDAGDDY